MNRTFKSSTSSNTTTVRNRRASSAKQRKQQHLLDVRMRSHRAAQQRNRKVFAWLSAVVLFAGTAAGVWFGGREALRRFVWENPDYNLSEIEIKTDGPLTREQVLETAAIREGQNIFTVNIATAQKALLHLPQIEHAEIERVLPHRINIEISERKPIAWVVAKNTDDPSASAQSFLIDRKGVLIQTQSQLDEYLRLPVICGVQVGNYTAGDSADTLELKAALDLLRLTADNPTRFQFRSIDVSKGYCLIAADTRHAQITFGLEHLDQQLERLGVLLDHIDAAGNGGREIQTANLLVQRNVPVTFMPPPAPEENAADETSAVETKPISAPETKLRSASSTKAKTIAKKPTIKRADPVKKKTNSSNSSSNKKSKKPVFDDSKPVRRAIPVQVNAA